DSDEAARDAAELRLRAERRLGELLAETVNHAGSRGVGNTVLPTLPDGISKMQSCRYQQAATGPEQVFEEHLTSTRNSGQERATNGVLRLARTPTKSRSVLCPSNGWTFNPPRYGRIDGEDNHGYIPGDVYCNILWYWAKDGDRVAEVMAGSGM